MMSYSEISSTYAPDFVRVELRSHIRYDGDKGTVGSAAFTWTAKDPHAVMMTLRWKERTNIWTLDVELLRRIVSSDRESVGDGQITGHTSGDVPDMVEHPPHYKQGGIETIDVIEAWQLGFCLGNAIKYISRAGKKDPGAELEDLKKARFYLNREIANIEKARAGGTDD
jgi:hypothetical protein